MERVAITNLEELSKSAGVSGLQIRRLQHGLILYMSVVTILRLASTLQISVETLIAKFTDSTESQPDFDSVNGNSQEQSPQFWQQEYQKLEQEKIQQAEVLKNEFQQATIQTIESWLIQWPTAVAAIEKNPELPAKRLIPLVKPVKQLIEQWGMETIAVVGEELPFSPQWHEPLKGSIEPGTMVKVRYVGYKQQDKILYKAKVSPIEES